MDILYEHCPGLDVHKKNVVACVLHNGPQGRTLKETRSFSTMLPGLEKLRDWLVAQGCTHAGMEATGVYWKPVYNVLESRLSLLVINAEHIKAVPGRKTDVKDTEWIAELVRHGLVRASFIPERDQRDLRELTRYRTALTQDRSRAVNRLQKTFEGANIKLASVLSDITGVSGQRILDALLAGEEDPEVMADLAHWRLQAKRPELEQSLMGQLRGRLRFVVGQQLRQIRSLDEQIEACDTEVEQEMLPFETEILRLDEIPGIARRGAENILAETGVDLSRWPTVAQFIAWSASVQATRPAVASASQRALAKATPGSNALSRRLPGQPHAPKTATWACACANSQRVSASNAP